MRPAEPTDLDFELEQQHIPENFLRGDIQVSALSLWPMEKSRHISKQNVTVL